VIGLTISATPEELGVLWEDGEEEPLVASASVAWKPQRGGAATIDVDLGDRGMGSFAICVAL